jgi:hypothetical protein
MKQFHDIIKSVQNSEKNDLVPELGLFKDKLKNPKLQEWSKKMKEKYGDGYKGWSSAKSDFQVTNITPSTVTSVNINNPIVIAFLTSQNIIPTKIILNQYNYSGVIIHSYNIPFTAGLSTNSFSGSVTFLNYGVCTLEVISLNGSYVTISNAINVITPIITNPVYNGTTVTFNLSSSLNITSWGVYGWSLKTQTNGNTWYYYNTPGILSNGIITQNASLPAGLFVIVITDSIGNVIQSNIQKLPVYLPVNLASATSLTFVQSSYEPSSLINIQFNSTIGNQIDQSYWDIFYNSVQGLYLIYIYNSVIGYNIQIKSIVINAGGTLFGVVDIDPTLYPVGINNVIVTPFNIIGLSQIPTLITNYSSNSTFNIEYCNQNTYPVNTNVVPYVNSSGVVSTSKTITAGPSVYTISVSQAQIPTTSKFSFKMNSTLPNQANNFGYQLTNVGDGITNNANNLPTGTGWYIGGLAIGSYTNNLYVTTLGNIINVTLIALFNSVITIEALSNNKWNLYSDASTNKSIPNVTFTYAGSPGYFWFNANNDTVTCSVVSNPF